MDHATSTLPAPRVRVLGPVEVDGPLSGQLTLGPARQRCVLAALLLDAGRPVSGSDLIDRVWGADAPPAADQALRSYLCRLRKVVEASGALRLERRHGGYAAVVADDDLDLATFRNLANRARVALRAGRHEVALNCFGQALALTGEMLLSGVSSDWLDERRRQLERERHTIALERNDLALATGVPDLVVDDTVERLAREPFDERVAGQAMLALAGVGRTADALAVFGQVRHRLGDELGIDPGPALQDIHQRVLRGVDRPAHRPTPAPRRPVPRQLPPMARGFVDRDVELSTLDRMLLAGDDESTTAVVCGPGGAGKTALAVRWAHRHAAEFPDGQLYVDLHGFDPGVRPVVPDVAVRGLLTALGLDPAGIPTDLTDMVGAYRTLLARRRVLLLADDVASADQVQLLLPPGAGSVALLTSRSGLPGLVASVGAHVLPVGLLATSAARELLIRRLGTARAAGEPDAMQRLMAHCGGLPLALALVAGRAAAAPSVSLTAIADDLDDDARRLATLSVGERGIDLGAVVAGSVATLSSTTRSVLEWLASGPRIGIRLTTVAVLAGLTERQAEEVLNELLGIHLLEPDGPGSYRLHDLVRLAVRSRPTTGLVPAIDRLLAFLITQGLEHGQDPADLLAALDHAAETGRDAVVCDLAEVLEAPLGWTGRWPELVDVHELAVDAAVRLSDDRRRSVALIGRGRGAIGLRDFERAGGDLAEALTLAETVDDLALRARAHRALARLAAHQHRYDLALRHDTCGLALHRRGGDVLGEAHAYNAIGWHQAHLGRAEEALENCRRGLMIFVEHDDRPGQALTQDSVGYALDQLGRPIEARDAYARSAALGRELGWQVMLANTLVRLADACCRLDDHLGAAAARTEAEEILRLAGRHALEP